jgi:UDP-N-acetylglucosamine--N-acetylmuramyl-(pentapeptide) pyrophosphoryl-undecaprenol N-acetylglucosamine transferase
VVQSIDKHFFFAGGGTGGHLYPALAVAEQIARIEPAAKIHFFCSSRTIDEHILSQTGFQYSVLPAKTIPRQIGKIPEFLRSILKSYKIAAHVISENKNTVVIGLGGFVAGPVCLAAHRRKIPVALLNVDIVPGRTNKIIARWADEIFVQFDDTAQTCAGSKAKVIVTGCPLRAGFNNPNPQAAKDQLVLIPDKKILLITGASTGSESINKVICSLLEKLDTFADNWQIVHLTGLANYEKIVGRYGQTKISHKVLGYYDDMPNLLAAADLVIGRSGAVSVAEFAAAGVPSICIPYPHHKDRQQYLNAGKLVEAGAAVIVDDLPNEKDFSEWLWEELETLLTDQSARDRLKNGCEAVAKKDASLHIARRLLDMLPGLKI